MVITAVKSEVEPIIDLTTAIKIVLILEYEGTRYHGFQLQASLPTVQDTDEALGSPLGLVLLSVATR